MSQQPEASIQRAKETLDTLINKTRTTLDVAEAVIDRSARRALRQSARVRTGVSRLGAEAQAGLEHARRGLTTAVAGSKGYVAAHPGQAALGALAVGVVAGMVVANRRSNAN